MPMYVQAIAAPSFTLKPANRYIGTDAPEIVDASNWNYDWTQFYMSGGDDRVIAPAAGIAYYFDGGAGNDYFRGDILADIVYGEIGDDTLDGWYGADTLNGGDGKDALYGGEDNDILNGDAGDDALWGGIGNDRLAGGAGLDGPMAELHH